MENDPSGVPVQQRIDRSSQILKCPSAGRGQSYKSNTSFKANLKDEIVNCLFSPTLLLCVVVTFLLNSYVEIKLCFFFKKNGNWSELPGLARTLIRKLFNFLKHFWGKLLMSSKQLRKFWSVDPAKQVWSMFSYLRSNNNFVLPT